MILGFLFRILIAWLVYKRKRNKINPYIRHMQLFSAALYSLGHGSNDAQKTMGIIASLLFSAGWIANFHIPAWVVLASYTVIALGTLMGGWKIVKTMGQKIAKLHPIDGFCAESASAVSIFLATYLGVPVSTTHVITGAISGTASARNVSNVKWGVAIQIVWAWFLTIPAAAIIAGLAYCIFKFL